jgi:adsorption protein B
LDHWVALLLTPLAFWVLLSGLDDCLIDAAAAFAWLRLVFLNLFRRSRPERIRTTAEPAGTPSDEELRAVPPRHIAVFIPVWKEHRVIRKMLDDNLAALRYPRFDFFVGAYPNDAPTLAALREAMKRHPSVHLAMCPHDGPTSKPDCLNWIYQRMLLYEEEHGVRFDMVVTHDAEDIIDPDALTWINYYAQWNDMVQIPVLALPTSLSEVTRGVYCDEFCEYQHKDMMARSVMGGFIPSNGVGAGFSRRALELLAAAHSNRVFEPSCLTEDYENGFRVASLGLRQKFIPIRIRHGRAIATRELFPPRFGAAVKQRERWITGIGLQSWEFHSFRETMRNFYWFWRDRKGLVGNIVGPLSNLLFLYGVVTLAWAVSTHRVWGLGHEAKWLAPASAAGLALQLFHTAIRIACCARVYGWRFAAAVPLRVVAGNWINCFATCRAVATYATARWRRQPLVWAKTDHAYPNRAALMADRRKLGEVLAGGQWLSREQLEAAMASKPATRRLGEHLLLLGLLTEEDLYTALALQHNLPLGKPEPSSVSLPVTRALPAAVAKKWRVLPFRISAGELYVAGSEIPGDEMQTDIRKFSSLEIRFQLVTPTEYRELAAAYLER